MKLSDLIEEHDQPISEDILFELRKYEYAVIRLVLHAAIPFEVLLTLEKKALVNILISHVSAYKLIKELDISWQTILSLEAELYFNLDKLKCLIKYIGSLERILNLPVTFRNQLLNNSHLLSYFSEAYICLEELMSLETDELDKIFLNSKGVSTLRGNINISLRSIAKLEFAISQEIFQVVYTDSGSECFRAYNLGTFLKKYSDLSSLERFVNLDSSTRRAIYENPDGVARLIRKTRMSLELLQGLSFPWQGNPDGLYDLLDKANISIEELSQLDHDRYKMFAMHSEAVITLLIKAKISINDLFSLSDAILNILFDYEYKDPDLIERAPSYMFQHGYLKCDFIYHNVENLSYLINSGIVSFELFKNLGISAIEQLFYKFKDQNIYLVSESDEVKWQKERWTVRKDEIHLKIEDKKIQYRCSFWGDWQVLKGDVALDHKDLYKAIEKCDLSQISQICRMSLINEISFRGRGYFHSFRNERSYYLAINTVRQQYDYLMKKGIISGDQVIFIALYNISFLEVIKIINKHLILSGKVPQTYQIKSKAITGLIEELQQLERLYEKVKLLNINNSLINISLSESAFLSPAPFFCDATIHCDEQLFVRISVNLQNVSYNRVENYRLKYWFKLILANAINQVFRSHAIGGIEKSKITALPIKCEGINEREYLFDYKIQFYDAYNDINLIQDNLDGIFSSEGFAYLSGYFSLELFDLTQNKCKELKQNNSHKSPRIKRFSARITPVDNNFPNFDGNYVMRSNDKIVAVSEGPDENNVESVSRFFYDLISEFSEHASKKIIVLAFGTFGIEFFRYVVSRGYVYKDKKIEVHSRKSLGSKNVDAYQLNINGKKACVYNLTSMPDGETANIDYSDLHLLNEIYSTNNCLFLHHCRAGLGRSAAFAISAILYMHLPKILKTIESHNLVNSVLSEHDLFNLIINPVLEIFNNRTVSPKKEQILQAIKVAFNLFSIKMFSDVDYNEFLSDFSKVTLATLIDYANVKNFLKESLPDESGIFDQFPFISDEWRLQYIQSKYHSFYSSIIEQMKIINHCFLSNIPIDILPDEYLRLCLQSAQVNNSILIEAQAILQIVLTFNLIIAILDLKNFDLGFRCYYLTSDAKVVADTFNPYEVPKNVPILRLVCINNHFSSVQKHPSLTMGAIRDGFIDPCLFLMSTSSSSFWGRQMTMLSKEHHVTYEGNMNEREKIDFGY